MQITGQIASAVAKSVALISNDGATKFADWYGKRLLVYPNHLKPITWERTVRTSRGLKMRARFQEVIGRELILNKDHEPELSARITEALQPGGTFVDVGANVGYFTLLASQLVGSSGLVMAFEPCHKNVATLAENLALNDCRNVVLFSSALSDSGGISKLTLPFDFNSGVASLGNGPSSDRTDPFARGFTLTPRFSFDSILASIGATRPIDVAKIDAEGHEPEVLHGMEECLKASPNMKLAVELSPDSYSVEDLCGYLRGLGFRGEYLRDGRWETITDARVPDGLCNAWFWRPHE